MGKNEKTLTAEVAEEFAEGADKCGYLFIEQEIETGYTCRMRRSGGTRSRGGGVGRAEVEVAASRAGLGAAGRSARTTLS